MSGGPGSSRERFATDVLVIGGGLAGVAAALAAAESGRRVLLTERRTYLGAEVTATLRPWLTGEQRAVLRDALGINDVAVPRGDGAERAVVPDRLKLALEDRLLTAGVELLYAAWPVGWSGGPDGIEVELATKAGRVTVSTAVLIDAIAPDEPLAAFGGWGSRRLEGPARFWRTLELTLVDLAALDLERPEALGLPAELAPAVRLHAGHDEHGHLLVEHALDIDVSQEPGWRRAAEQDARTVSLAVARWLREHHPAFARARATAASPELAGPPAWRVPGGGTASGTVEAPGGPVPASAFRTPVGVWVASAAADVNDETAEGIARDPAALARLGRDVGALASLEASGPVGESSAPRHSAVERRVVDVLVVGGGTSGAPAAIGAARAGARALVVEMNADLGGAGTVGGVDSYWFGRRGGFNLEVAACVADRNAGLGWPAGGKWSTLGKSAVWLELAREAGAEVVTEAVLVEVRADGGRVTGALFATPAGLLEVEAAVTVDATGDGDVAVRAGAPAVYGSDREGLTMWYSMAPHPRPGMTKNNFTSNVDVGNARDYTRAILAGRRRLGGHDHGPYVAPRESRHVLGGVRLTLTDQLTIRRWPDAVNVAFSNHDVKGQTTSDWLRMGLIPPNLEVEIPYRALVPQDVDGLVVTGKAFSATHDALPAIRMQADLENLGFVCGIAAAMCAALGLEPRDLDVRELQARLVEAGLVPADVLTRSMEPEPEPTTDEMRGWIAALDDAQKLYEISFMDFHEVRREPIPLVQVCTAGPRVAPLLREDLEQPGSPRRLMVARALAWHGDRAATPVLLESIERELAADTLPHRAAMPFTQASPDHGAMPDLAYQLHTLAWVRDERAIPVLERVVGRLEPTDERLRDQMSGLFHYVDAVCDVAERLGFPECIPVLERLRAYPLLHGHRTADGVQPDFFLERLAYLELVINRALARCGSLSGAAVLVDYLRDARRPLARHAHRELVSISGLDRPNDPDVWEAWLASLDGLAPAPWVGERG